MTLTNSEVTCISAETNGDPLPPLPLSQTHTHTHTHTNSSSDGDKNGKRIDCGIFSVEEELRFSNRFEEGYDLYDPKYKVYTPSTPSTSCNSTLVVPSVSKSQATPRPHTSAVSGSKTLSGRFPLSDLLDLPKNVLDTKQKTGRAHVLTECLHLLKENEEKKNKYNWKRKGENRKEN